MVNDKRISLKAGLAISEEDLNSCLIEQPELFFSVADAYAYASAERDAAKLALEEVMSELDQQLRLKAAKDEEKVTEASLGRHLATLPRVQKAQREFLECKADADEWGALKEAFVQRSFMLRELVALYIANLSNLSLEKGAHGASKDLRAAESDRVDRMRRASK